MRKLIIAVTKTKCDTYNENNTARSQIWRRKIDVLRLTDFVRDICYLLSVPWWCWCIVSS